jgi:Uncharacterized protein conserved in bacteria (DUF2332)
VSDHRALADVWIYVADSSCRGYAPLYDRICRAVAGSDAVLEMVAEAPPEGHNPVLLLAAVHHLLLGASSTRWPPSTQASPTPTPARCSSTCAGSSATSCYHSSPPGT